MPARTSKRRDTTIPIRARAEDRDLIDRAARSLGKTRSEFMLDTVRKEAQTVLADQTHFVLEPEQWDAFVKALDKPPKDNPKLRALLSRRAIWEK